MSWEKAEGGRWQRHGRALAEALRLNSTLTSLNCSDGSLGEEVQSALGQAWGDRGGSFNNEKEGGGQVVYYLPGALTK
jgi:hypothetical protein